MFHRFFFIVDFKYNLYRDIEDDDVIVFLPYLTVHSAQKWSESNVTQ